MPRPEAGDAMVNPWSQLPTDAPHVLRHDLPIVEEFNKHYARNPDIKIQSHLLPEPFIGDPSAGVYLLNLNPGYSPEDDDWHRKPVYRTATIENLGHKPTAYPSTSSIPAWRPRRARLGGDGVRDGGSAMSGPRRSPATCSVLSCFRTIRAGTDGCPSACRPTGWYRRQGMSPTSSAKRFGPSDRSSRCSVLVRPKI